MLSKITIPFVYLLALFILTIAGLQAQDQQITILITPDDFQKFYQII